MYSAHFLTPPNAMIIPCNLTRTIPLATLAATTNTSLPFDPVTGECIDINGCRTTTDILWSCISVILSCTWVAIHPNIPEVGTHSAVALYQSFELMVIALLAPEIIILWAMRQWYSARNIAKQFQKYGWGMSHAFLVIMGGFTLYDGDKLCGYLWEKLGGTDLEYLNMIKNLHPQMQKLLWPPGGSCPIAIDQPHDVEASSEPKERENSTCLLEYLIANGYITTTADEIEANLSHGNILTKSFALTQTTWFLLQVVSRAVGGFAVTELEIVTIGYALLNFGTYFLWWNKPLGVRYPVRITWRQRKLNTASQSPEKSEGSRMEMIQEGFRAVVAYIRFRDSSDDTAKLIQLISLPLFLPLHLLSLCYAIVFDQEIEKHYLRICSRLDDDPLRLYITVYSIAAAFGAIHCIPWASQFPTHTEQLVCRICAVAVPAVPIVMGCLHWYFKELHHVGPLWSEDLILVTIILLTVFYIFARISFIVIALMALRDVSPNAHQTIQWMAFIPHIG